MKGLAKILFWLYKRLGILLFLVAVVLLIFDGFFFSEYEPEIAKILQRLGVFGCGILNLVLVTFAAWAFRGKNKEYSILSVTINEEDSLVKALFLAFVLTVPTFFWNALLAHMLSILLVPLGFWLLLKSWESCEAALSWSYP